MALNRPVILIGPTRSGKTLLGSVLSGTDQFGQLFEPITIWNAGHIGRIDDVRDANDATPEIAAKIRRELEASLARIGKPRLIDDLPHHTFRIPFCEAVLPGARYILMTRNAMTTIPAMLHGWTYRDSIVQVARRRLGRDRRASMRLSTVPRLAIKWFSNRIRVGLGLRKIAWGPTAPGQREYARRHTLAETIAFQWCSMVRHALDGIAALPPDRTITVRFEDLIEQQTVTARRLGTFCELKDDRSLLDSIRCVIDAHRANEAWVEPTPEQWKEISRIIAPTQRLLGYGDLNS